MPESYNDKIMPPIESVVADFGYSPLAGTPLGDQTHLEANPETVLAMAMDALIKSRPISHELSRKTINHLIEEGYHDINTLSNSTWDERTDVLREGGYNRYREQGATNLGGLGTLVNIKYGMHRFPLADFGVCPAPNEMNWLIYGTLQMEILTTC